MKNIMLYTPKPSIKPRVYKRNGKWCCTLVLNGSRYDTINAESAVESVEFCISLALKFEGEKGMGMSNGSYNGVTATIARWCGYKENYIRSLLGIMEK